MRLALGYLRQVFSHLIVFLLLLPDGSAAATAHRATVTALAEPMLLAGKGSPLSATARPLAGYTYILQQLASVSTAGCILLKAPIPFFRVTQPSVTGCFRAAIWLCAYRSCSCFAVYPALLSN